MNSRPQTSAPAAHEPALAAARAALARGDFAAVARLCEPLAQQGALPEALNLLGLAAHRSGRPEEAARHLERAVKEKRDAWEFQYNLGNVMQDLGKLDRAISAYRRALRLKPDLAMAHNDLGTAYFAKGWMREAIECYRECIRLEPEHWAAHENLGAALRSAGDLREARRSLQRAFRLRVTGGLKRLLGIRKRAPRPDDAQKKETDAQFAEASRSHREGKPADALALCEKILARESDHADAKHLVGYILNERGEHERAIELIGAAIRLKPGVPEFHNNLGNAYSAAGRMSEALACYLESLRLEPHAPVTLNNLGAANYVIGDYPQAERCAKAALEQDPDLVLARVNLGSVYWAGGELELAERYCREAIERDPKIPEAWSILAIVLKDLGRFEEARTAHDQALRLAPDNAVILGALGNYIRSVDGNIEESLRVLRKAQALKPRYAEAHLAEAFGLLGAGRYAEGWPKYEWRKQHPERSRAYRKFPYPDWTGGPLEGRNALIFGEQGLGDEIMLASCYRDAIAEAKHCHIVCDARLEALIRRSFPAATVLAESRQSDGNTSIHRPAGIDVQIAAGTLPLRYRREPRDFPPHSGYLRAEPASVEEWKRRLAEPGVTLSIGLSWRGGLPSTGRAQRSLSLERLLTDLGGEGRRFVNLQYGDRAAEIAAAVERTGVAVRHWPDAIDDLDQTAALVCALDVVIAVCSTLVHLTGALGREAWVLTPFIPEWRYGMSGERMPWYPAVRLYRQPGHHDWDSVLARVRADLDARQRRASGYARRTS